MNGAVRASIARASEIARRAARAPVPLLALAGVVLLGLAALALRIGRTPVFPFASALSYTDPSMPLINAMVERGDMSGASARVGSSYRFDRAADLMALRRFSILVLRRGLDEDDPYLRCYAISALAAAGDRDELVRLQKIFRKTRKVGIRMAVADGLGDVGDDDAVATLRQLYDATDPSYRRILVIGAAETGNAEAVDLLSNALGSADRTMRLTAARGLGQLASGRAIAPLRRYLAAAGDSYERAMAAYSLERLGDRSAEPVAERIVRGHGDDAARAMAGLALGRARDARALATLRVAIGDRNLDVRLAAAVALTHYGDPAGLAYLKAAVRDEDSVTRLYLGQLLDEMDFHNAREVVMAAAASDDPQLSLQGIRTIGLKGGPAEVAFLAGVADRAADPAARGQVAWALGRIGGRAVVAPLVAMVSDPDHAVRYTAADALDRAALRQLTSGALSGGA